MSSLQPGAHCDSVACAHCGDIDHFDCDCPRVLREQIAEKDARIAKLERFIERVCNSPEAAGWCRLESAKLLFNPSLDHGMDHERGG